MPQLLRSWVFRIVLATTALLSLCSCSARVESPKSLEELYEVQMQMLVDPGVPQSDRGAIMGALEKSNDRILWKVLIEHWDDTRIVDPEYSGDWSMGPEFTTVLSLGSFCSELFYQLTNMAGYSSKEEMQEWWEKSKGLYTQEIEEQWAKSHGFSSWVELRKSFHEKQDHK